MLIHVYFASRLVVILLLKRTLLPQPSDWLNSNLNSNFADSGAVMAVMATGSNILFTLLRSIMSECRCYLFIVYYSVGRRLLSASADVRLFTGVHERSFQTVFRAVPEFRRRTEVQRSSAHPRPAIQQNLSVSILISI